MNNINNFQYIIDTDPGIDDAIAIAMALTNENFDVKLITTVAGNVSLTNTTNNALKLVEFLKSDVPVAKGSAEPLLKELEDASYFHGETGMDGYDFPTLTKKPIKENAIQKMKDVILEGDKNTTIIALGPLTNIALLIKTFPEVVNKIDRIVFMGGGFKTGNTSSVAEFNIYNDPHALEILIRSTIECVMVGFDVTTKALIRTEEINKIKEFGKLGEMVYSLFSHYRGGTMETGLRIHDASTIAYLLEPTMFEVEHLHVETVLEGPAIGATVTNILDKSIEPKNLHVCLEVDSIKYKKWFVEEIERASKTI